MNILNKIQKRDVGAIEEQDFLIGKGVISNLAFTIFSLT